MDSSGVPSPGWFPDPGDPSGERWWSGEAWTDHTRRPDAAAALVATAVPVAVAFAEPVAPAPAAAAAAGFVMPDLSAQPLLPLPAPEPMLSPAASAPAAPRASAAPVVIVPAAPSGLPSTADPDIASHYRQALNAPEPMGVGAALAPPLAGSPAQAGWGGMPLPSAGGYDPAGGYRAPGDTRATSSYAAARTAANATVQSGSNKVATIALSTGLSSLGALVLVFFGRIVIVPSLLSLVAIVMGIVGLALVRRTGAGLWPALGGLLMGLATSVAVVTSIVLAVFEAATVDTELLEREIVEESASYYGVDVVNANCPSEVSIFNTTEFTCTAIDSSGVAYLVDVEITDEGLLLWELRL